MSAKNERPRIIPGMRYRDAAAAIDWLCKAFGFERHLVVPGENGRIEHAQLVCGNGMIMLGSLGKGDSEYDRLIKSSPTRSAARRRRAPTSSLLTPTRTTRGRGPRRRADRIGDQRRGLGRPRLHLPRPGGAHLELRHLRSLGGKGELTGCSERLELIRDFHRGADFLHRGLSHGAAFARPFRDNLIDLLRFRLIFGAVFANRREEWVERVVELLLHFNVADRALTITLLQIFDLRLIRNKGIYS